MICDRCDLPILPGQDYDSRDIITNSGPGATVHLHTPLCKRALIQTASPSPRRQIPELEEE